MLCVVVNFYATYLYNSASRIFSSIHQEKFICRCILDTAHEKDVGFMGYMCSVFVRLLGIFGHVMTDTITRRPSGKTIIIETER